MRFMTYVSFLSFLSNDFEIQYLEIQDNSNEDKEDDQDKEDKDFGNEEFAFSNFEVEADKVQVESTSANYDIEYEIECEDTDPITSKLKFKSTNCSTNEETETKSRVIIHGLQEWADENEDGIMQDNETVGDMYYIGENGYNAITYDGPDLNNIYNFFIEEKPLGYLTMIAHLTTNFTNYYDPNSMKFDLVIQNWDFQSADNLLALLMEYRTETETETSNDYDDEDDKKGRQEEANRETDYVYQTTTDPSLGFSALQWNKTIVYDDTIVGKVNTRLLNASELSKLIYTDDEYEGEQATGIWFCFDAKAANKIVWDPTIGVYTTPLNQSTSTSAGASSSSSSSSALSDEAILGVAIACSLSLAVAIFLFMMYVFKRFRVNTDFDLKSFHLVRYEKTEQTHPEEIDLKI